VLIFTLIASFSTAFAADETVDVTVSSKLLDLKTDSEGQEYLSNNATGEKIVAAFRIDDNGDIIYLDLSEYAEIINTQQSRYS